MTECELTMEYELKYEATVQRLKGRLGNEEDARDVAQDLWRKFFARGAKLRADTFEHYWNRAIVYAAGNEFRRRQRRPKAIGGGEYSILDTIEAKPETSHVDRERLKRVEAEVQNLDSTYQAIYRLVFVEEITERAAAEKLKLHHSTVQERVRRLRTRLRNVA